MVVSQEIRFQSLGGQALESELVSALDLGRRLKQKGGEASCMHYLKDIQPHVDGRSCCGDGLGESNERRHQRWVRVGGGPCVVSVALCELFILGSGKAAHHKVFLAPAVPRCPVQPQTRLVQVLACSRTWVAQPAPVGEAPGWGGLLGCWCVGNNNFCGIVLFLHGQPGSEALMQEDVK